MNFWSLFIVALTPVLQVLLIVLLGAFLASSYCSILTPDARRDINKVVFAVFCPALIFASLAETVTLKDIISWWFMPINIAIAFVIGGTLGWIAVKILRPRNHLDGLVVACCSAGNMGTLPLIIIPAICNEDASPFGEASICSSLGLSYVSFSMAIANIYIWTHTYYIMKKSAILYKKIHRNDGLPKISSNNDSEITSAGREEDRDYEALLLPSSKPVEGEETEHETTASSSSSSARNFGSTVFGYWKRIEGNLGKMMEELLSPPTVAAIVGLVFGATPKLRTLIIGDSAPARVIQDSVKLLGGGTIPCITLILGGNLTKGIRKSTLKPLVVIAVLAIRYAILPVCGVGVVMAADKLGFLPQSQLYRYVLLIQFTVPPAMSIGTIAQLFDVGEAECSAIFFWTYLVAALALTAWSTVFMWILF